MRARVCVRGTAAPGDRLWRRLGGVPDECVLSAPAFAPLGTGLALPSVALTLARSLLGLGGVTSWLWSALRGGDGLQGESIGFLRSGVPILRVRYVTTSTSGDAYLEDSVGSMKCAVGAAFFSLTGTR